MFQTSTTSFNIPMRFLFALAFFMATSSSVKSQVIFTEGFEINVPPTGWSTQNYTSGGNNWGQYSWDKNSGIYSAAIFSNGVANAWLFTRSLNLVAGKYYELKYYAKTNTSTLLKVTLGTGADMFSQPKILHNSFTVTGMFNLVKDTFVCEQTGTYYIGFNDYSTALNNNGSLIDDVTFTDLNLPNCNTVSAGTVSSPVSSICANALFTINNTGATVNTVGVKYAWQRSTDNVTWTNITNSYTYQSSIQVSQTVPTYYRLADTCLISSANTVSNALLININSFLTCYCTPATINCAQNLSFTNVTILTSTINNTSTCSPNGYGNFASVGNANVYRDQQIYIRHTINNPNNYYPYTVGVWGDWNHNGIFEASEFAMNGPFTTPTVNASQILVPGTALTGETRLRLKLRVFGTITGDESCTGTQSGETEDYKITVGDAANCSGAVSAGTISAVSQICPNNSFTITATNPTIYQGQMRYAWQRSTDNINWVNINNAGYLVNPLTTSTNNNMYYRLTDTCLVSAQSAVSNSILVTTTNIFNCYCVPPAATCTSYGIDSVSFNTIHNASGCGAGGYSNYTNISTTVNNGINLPIYLKVRPATAVSKYAAVYIDFNRNGSFEATERVLTGVSTNGNISGNVNIPFNVNPGETGMRVIVSSSTVFDACSSIFTGETEDYKIILNINSPVTNKFCYYVKQSATGVNDGNSWTNAFTSLATPFGLLTKGDTIKVAKGVYTPGTTTVSNFTLRDSVMIMGGYPDTGNPTDLDRHPGNHQTKMSGEIGLPDSTDNIRIILAAANVKGFVVDGFIIERSYNTGSSGNGVYFNGATGTVKNSVVRNNYYVNYNNGSAINALNSTVTFINSFFEGNQTDNLGGTGSVFNFSAKSNITLVNSVIAKNKASLLINQFNSTSKLINCTAFKNYGFSSFHDTSSLIVQNSIFYRNGINYAVDTAEFIKDLFSVITVNNTLTEVYNVSAPGFLGGDPKFTDTANLAGIDGRYFTTDDGLRVLNPCSPAINAGNNSFVAGINTDIAGATRIKNGIVDLGAYEVQEAISSMPAVIYVKKNATGLNNGTSWQNAFTDLQSAFYGCTDTIKVAKGIYPVSLSDQGASFTMNNHRIVIGGYPDFGSPTNNDINTELYPSVLDGKINSNLKCPTVVLSNYNDSTARMIGFEIINSASPVYYENLATLKVASKSSPYFEKIKLNGLTNQASYLLYITDLSKPKFYNCTFYNGYNQANQYDGARTVYILNGSEPKFVRSYIGKDTTAANTSNIGAKFSFFGSGGTIDSCIFSRAAHDAVVNQNSYTQIQNSQFIKTQGRSIQNIASNTVIYNSIFLDSVYAKNFDGGIIHNNGGSDVIIDKCRFYNSVVSWNGGAVANDNSSTSIKNSVFRNCRAGSGGGALFNNAGKLKLINSAGFYSSISGTFSQGQFLKGTGNSSNTVINSTIITDNTGYSVLHTGPGDTLKLYNSILWRYGFSFQMNQIGNDVSTGNDNNTAVCDIRSSILFKQAATALSNSTVGINPRLTDLSYPEGFDNVLYSADDGLKPCTCSPAVNAGNNSLNPESLDILATNRVYNGTIDIGAYEVPANPTTDKTFFVKENAAAGGNGVSWSGAYNSLQKAVQNNCADTIKVAKGKYKPATTGRDSTFNVYRGVVILGGYPDAGNPGDQDRNVNANPTILSGDVGSLNDSTDNSYNVMMIHCPDTTVLVDGIIVERGNADAPYTNNSTNSWRQGGGIYVVASKSLTLNKCTIRNNYGYTGGGLYFRGSGINVNKSVFSNNNSQNGGGFYTDDDYAVVNGFGWGPPVNIRNSVFSTNKGGAGTIAGNGVIAYQNNYRFENLVVYKNEGYGAGFRFQNQPYVTLVNCIFARNNSLSFNPGVAIIATNPYTTLTLNTYVFNSIFLGNTIMGVDPSYLNNDFNWVNGNAQQETIPYQNLAYSAVPGNQTGSGPGMIGNGVSLQDINNGPGPDNIWITPDDGVRPTACANTLNKGSNTYVQNIPLDILDSVRIQNAIVDMGPYELGNGGAANPTATIIATDTTICAGSSITFNAYVTGANGNTVYQWKRNSSNVGTNSSVFTSSSLANNDTIKVEITINNPCVNTQTVTSNSILIHVSTALSAAVSISSSANPGCAGTLVIYTAIPVNGGQSPTYQWKVNGTNAGVNSPTFGSTTFSNNDVITVVMTSSLSCATNSPATSNAVTQTINTMSTPAVSITATAPGCVGTPITFTANPVNGGTAPSYQWKVNGINAGTNSPTFTSSTLNENDVVTVVMTSNSACATTPAATSTGWVVHYSTGTTASVNITAGAIGCPGTSITFTANPVNGGTAPSYQWKVNGTNVGSNSPTFTSSLLNENDVVVVVMTSNAACVSTPVVTSTGFVVHYSTATTASVNITASTTSICQGTSVTFTAVPVNGGTAPSYQWQVNGINAGTNNAVFSTANLANSAQVKVVMTGTASCGPAYTVTSNIISIQVQQLAVPVIVLNSPLLTVTNPDAAAIHTWQVLSNSTWFNVVPTATGITYNASNGGTFRVKAVKGSCTQYSASQVAALVSPVSNYIYLRPNPAHNYIRLDSIRLSKKWKVVDITDMAGRRVLPLVDIVNRVTVTIDITILPPGTYLAVIKQQDGVHVTKKFVKL